MSLEIRTPDGKLFGFTDCEEEFVVVNNKKIALHDVYQDEKLLQDFNEEVKHQIKELEDVTK